VRYHRSRNPTESGKTHHLLNPLVGPPLDLPLPAAAGSAPRAACRCSLMYFSISLCLHERTDMHLLTFNNLHIKTCVFETCVHSA